MKGNGFTVNVESTRYTSTKDDTNMMMDKKSDNKVQRSLSIAVTYGPKIFGLIKQMAGIDWLI